MIKNNVLILIFCFSVFVFPQDEDISASWSLSPDSLSSVLNDMKDILSSDMIDEITAQAASKDKMTYKKLFDITGNEFVSRMILEKISSNENQISANIGFYSKTADTDSTKTFVKGIADMKKVKVALLAEKDIGENDLLDSYKGSLRYNSVIAGNFRIKTGRGLFSDYSRSFYLYDAPFFSDRVEPDINYDEYPSFLGAAYSHNSGLMILSIFASCNYYDASADSTGDIERILVYNVHDDSLSLSRKNNLREILGGAIIRNYTEIVNAAFYYAQYSSRISDNNSDNGLFICDIYGNWNFLSYDICSSYPNGYAFSSGLKKNFDNASFYIGGLYNDSLFNPHSRSYVAKDKYYGIFAEIYIKSPIKIRDKIESMVDDGNKIRNRIDINVQKHLDVSFKAVYEDILDYSMTANFKAFLNDEFSLKNSYTVTKGGSILVRADAAFVGSIFKANSFGYFYMIDESENITVYDYVMENVYPVRTLSYGAGYRCGFTMENPVSSRMKYNIMVIYDSKFGYSFGGLLGFQISLLSH